MYGYKGGDKTTLRYPSVEAVREQFYATYQGLPIYECERERGDINKYNHISVSYIIKLPQNLLPRYFVIQTSVRKLCVRSILLFNMNIMFTMYNVFITFYIL